MKPLLCAALLLACAGFLPAAEFTPTPLSVLGGDNLKARWAEHWAVQDELRLKLYEDGYAKHVQHGPWDEHIATMTRELCRDGRSYEAAQKAAAAAEQAGCRDPLVLYHLPAKHPIRQARRTIDLLDLGEAMTKAGYSPLHEQVALNRGFLSLKPADLDNVVLCDRIVANASRLIPVLAAEAGGDRAMISAVFFDYSLVLGEDISHWSELWTAKPALVRLLNRLAEAVPTATIGLDPWWQDVILGGYQARSSLFSQDAGMRASARTRLERAALAQPEHNYPACVLMRLAAVDQPGEVRRWFEASFRADPMRQQTGYDYLAFLHRSSNKVDALLDFGVECAEANDDLADGLRMNVFNYAGGSLLTSEGNWQDPRFWRLLDATFPDRARSQGDRLACAWRCGVRQEAVRLWRLKPTLRASSMTLKILGGTQAQIASDCAAWAAAAEADVTPGPASGTGDF